MVLLAVVLASQVLLRGINGERATQGVAALTPDACLSELAQRRADDMVRRDYFSHITPNGETPFDLMRAQGCTFHRAAENIAMTQDPQQALEGLWNSPEHRRNTLDPNFTRVGIGIAPLGDGNVIFVEDFSD